MPNERSRWATLLLAGCFAVREPACHSLAWQWRQVRPGLYKLSFAPQCWGAWSDAHYEEVLRGGFPEADAPPFPAPCRPLLPQQPLSPPVVALRPPRPLARRQPLAVRPPPLAQQLPPVPPLPLVIRPSLPLVRPPPFPPLRPAPLRTPRRFRARACPPSPIACPRTPTWCRTSGSAPANTVARSSLRPNGAWGIHGLVKESMYGHSILRWLDDGLRIGPGLAEKWGKQRRRHGVDAALPRWPQVVRRPALDDQRHHVLVGGSGSLQEQG